MTSKLQVDSIVNVDNDGPVVFPQGINLGSGQSLNSSGGMNIDGTLTATTFVGDGSNLSGLEVISNGKAISQILIN